MYIHGDCPGVLPLRSLIRQICNNQAPVCSCGPPVTDTICNTPFRERRWPKGFYGKRIAHILAAARIFPMISLMIICYAQVVPKFVCLTCVWVAVLNDNDLFFCWRQIHSLVKCKRCRRKKDSQSVSQRLSVHQYLYKCCNHVMNQLLILIFPSVG